MNYRKKLLVFCEICLLAVVCSIFLSACFDLSFTNSCNGNQTTCKDVGNSSSVDPAATATQSAIRHIYATLMKSQPVLVDTLSQPDQNQWPTDFGCDFQAQSYVVSAHNDGYWTYCASDVLKYGDAAIQVDATLTDGMEGGMVFRGQYVKGNGAFYFFYITTDGQFGMDLYKASDSGTAFSSELISLTHNDAITGAEQRNQLLVVMKGPNLMLFDNGAFLAQLSDNTFTSGFVGVGAVNNSSTDPNASSFANLVVYKD